MGAFTNGSYLVGSIIYRIFIVKSKPVNFYRWWYPAALLILFGANTALWFNVPTVVILIMMSISQIIPYYVSYYDYYLFTEKCDEESYGFTVGVYGATNTVVTALVQLFYLLDIKFVTILIINVVLLTISFVYSYYLAHLTK